MALVPYDPEDKKCASALAEAWEKVTSIRRKAQCLKAARAWNCCRIEMGLQFGFSLSLFLSVASPI